MAKDPDRPLPTSVRDAVLARTADVAPDDFEVLQLAATAPDRLDDRLLPALGVDLPTLRRLDATGLLTRTRAGLVFRHELARQAVESTIPPGGGPRLHARLLDALERLEPREPAVLTHHAVAACDAVRAARYAEAAAVEAIHAGSHSEAAAFFQTALDHLDLAPPGDRAELLQRLSFEQYMTSRLGDAIENVRATFPLWQRAGDPAGLAEAHETCAVYEYYNARRHQAEAHADRAAEIAREAGTELAYGVARATRGFLAYHRGELGLALECIGDAGRIAGEHGEGALALKSDLVQAAAAVVRGEPEARPRLVDTIETARAEGWDELASTGYSALSNLDVEQRRYRSAEHVLDESLPFTVARDIPICRHWQTGVRSRLRFSQGRWNAAVEDAHHVLDDRGHAAGPALAARDRRTGPAAPGERGRHRRRPEAARAGGVDVAGHLESAWRLAGQIDEPRGRLAVLAALAEQMWMTGARGPPGHRGRRRRPPIAWPVRRARRGPWGTSRRGCGGSTCCRRRPTRWPSRSRPPWPGASPRPRAGGTRRASRSPRR